MFTDEVFRRDEFQIVFLAFRFLPNGPGDFRIEISEHLSHPSQPPY